MTVDLMSATLFSISTQPRAAVRYFFGLAVIVRHSGKMLAVDLVSSNLTIVNEILPHLTSVEVIVKRAMEEPWLSRHLDAASTVIKSPRFFHAAGIAKRDVMDDIVATYGSVFGKQNK